MKCVPCSQLFSPPYQPAAGLLPDDVMSCPGLKPQAGMITQGLEQGLAAVAGIPGGHVADQHARERATRAAAGADPRRRGDVDLRALPGAYTVISLRDLDCSDHLFAVAKVPACGGVNVLIPDKRLYAVRRCSP